MENQYFITRHGESRKNVKNIAASWPEKFYSPLTEKGEKQVKKAAKKLKKSKVNLIFSSDLLRAKQTAEIIGKELGIKPKFDKGLREVGVGIFNGKPLKEAGNFWNKKEEKFSPVKHYLSRFKLAPPGGENYIQVERRIYRFLKDVDKKYSGKNILIVGHQRPLTLLEKTVSGQSRENFVKKIIEKREIKTGEVRRLKISRRR